MRGEAWSRWKERETTIIVATRHDRLADGVFSVPVARHVRWARARTHREIEAMLSAGPHPAVKPAVPAVEGEEEPLRVLVLSQDVDPSAAFELVGETLRHHPGLKIIFIAQQLDPNVECVVRAQGVHFILAEPVEVTILERVIRKAVEHETTKRRLTRRYA